MQLRDILVTCQYTRITTFVKRGCKYRDYMPRGRIDMQGIELLKQAPEKLLNATVMRVQPTAFNHMNVYCKE